MDYEQKYKEALGRARKIENREPLDVPDGTSIPVAIFPELKEGEGEKIRKQIISFLKEFECDHYRSLDFSSWIAWLEKQDKKDSQVILPHFTFDDILALQCCMETVKKVQEDKDLYEKLKDLHGRVYDAYQIEKQGEQNPTDKVEPKFKKGDWVIDKQGIVHQIANVIENVTYHTYGYDIVGGGYFNDNSDVRLWTIKDAKEGDVLCTYECDEPKIVFILKGTPKKHRALSYYCYYNIMYPYFEYDSETGGLMSNEEDVKPATKEQRDLLRKAMLKVGYKWDAENRELKKL